MSTDVPEVPEKTLGRIRALLAKAEDPAATPEESESYFEKAAELMARYGVDRAMLAADDPTSDIPGDRIVVIEGSYYTDKKALLAGIAEELGCRAVLRVRWVNDAKQHSVHLFGHASDLERVDMVYTSLLVQIINGLAKAQVPDGENTRSFRVSWLAGFRIAVVDRLRRAEARAKDQATQQRAEHHVSGPSVALVLADRRDVVEAKLAEVYPKLRKGRARQITGSGYQDGYHAGTRADLGGPRMTRGRRPSLGS
jgi:Protein of unknown function (DUF2786)